MPLAKALEVRADVFGFMWDKAFLLDLFFTTMAIRLLCYRPPTDAQATVGKRTRRIESPLR